MRLINADRLIMELLDLWQYFLERKRAKETMIIWTVITRVNEMAIEEMWKHELSKERQRTANAHPTHECVKPTHECVSREAALDVLDDFQHDIEYGVDSYAEHRERLLNLPEHVGNSKHLDRTCAKCKFYTADGICVQWSRYGFREEDYCSRWEEKGA